jgi:tRNA dimethylallyltransferase
MSLALPDQPLPPAVFLMGPTASGKTELAIQLAETGRFELISVDSGMIYRGMDIGTAKPDAAELARAPHRLIDVIDPAEAWSAADFRRAALSAMEEIHAAGRIPLLVGGTMLYFKVLKDGLADMPEADETVRAAILSDALQHGWPSIHARLAEVDPITAARLKPNDSQRLQRALEVWLVTGKPMSQWHAEQQSQSLPWNVLELALMPDDRAVLHERIERRFDLMLQRGFVEEVERLRARGDLSPDLPSMRSVGYRQVWEYLDGQIDREEMRYRGVVATRQLAKRQFTWLRGFGDTVHFLTTEAVPIVRQKALQKVENHLKLDTGKC